MKSMCCRALMTGIALLQLAGHCIASRDLSVADMERIRGATVCPTKWYCANVTDCCPLSMQPYNNCNVFIPLEEWDGTEPCGKVVGSATEECKDDGGITRKICTWEGDFEDCCVPYGGWWHWYEDGKNFGYWCQCNDEPTTPRYKQKDCVEAPQPE